MHVTVRISGAICGDMWMPQVKAGRPINVDLTDYRDRFTAWAGITETVESIVMHEGGDFQCARFTADTEIILETRRKLGPGKYLYRCKRFQFEDCPSLADWTDPEAYVCDFLGEDF